MKEIIKIEIPQRAEIVFTVRKAKFGRNIFDKGRKIQENLERLLKKSFPDIKAGIKVRYSNFETRKPISNQFFEIKIEAPIEVIKEIGDLLHKKYYKR